MVLAMSIGVFAPLGNDLEQVRNGTVGVTRVPTIPLSEANDVKFTY